MMKLGNKLILILSLVASVECFHSPARNMGVLSRTEFQTHFDGTIQKGDKTMTRGRTSTSLNFGDFFKKKEPEPEPEPAEPKEEEEVIDEDPVEKLFGFLFGKKEAEPFGLSRFGPEKFPEQYPAIKDEWAEPLPDVDVMKEMQMIRPLLKNTNLERRALKLTYDANRDGWDALKFHSKVDRLGGAVVYCKTRSGIICGGYNPKGWVGYGEARGSIAAFLFVIKGPNGPKAGLPGVKLIKVGGAGLAQIDNPENGPSFGADSLVIPLGRDTPKLARSKLGSYYERFEDGTNSLFGNDSAVLLQDLKVFHGVYEEGEYIPFTDAEPFALY